MQLELVSQQELIVMEHNQEKLVNVEANLFVPLHNFVVIHLNMELAEIWYHIHVKDKIKEHYVIAERRPIV